MSPLERLGPFCQSCSMPLENPEDFGTSASGHRANDYCRYCYKDGAFTDPAIPLERMIDQCAGIMARRGIMPEAKARALLTDVLPGMKRWRETATQEACQCAGGRGFQAGDPEC
jgi:hypothetical protein